MDLLGYSVVDQLSRLVWGLVDLRIFHSEGWLAYGKVTPTWVLWSFASFLPSLLQQMLLVSVREWFWFNLIQLFVWFAPFDKSKLSKHKLQPWIMLGFPYRLMGPGDCSAEGILKNDRTILMWTKVLGTHIQKLSLEEKQKYIFAVITNEKLC